jgi:hypothetical protein
MMPQDAMECDVCIIGAGPAGMMAAIAARAGGVSVCIVEKNSAVGRKLLLTGGGRCNLTHAGGIEDFVRDCFPYGNALKPAFYAFSPQQTLDFFHQHQLQTYTDEDGCVFPVSERAQHVCGILLEQLQQQGVAIHYGQAVAGVENNDRGFSVVTAKRRIACTELIVATGGRSWPQTGSTGDGYAIAEQFGHSIVPQVGVLCPMVVREDWAGALQGLSLPKAAIRMKVQSKAKLFTGKMVFTADGIGGPAVFDVSRSAAELLHEQKGVPVTIDFYPDRTREEVSALLIERCAAHPKKDIAGLLCEWFPRRLSAFLKTQACGDEPVLACALPKVQRQKLVEAIKAMPLTLIRSGSLEKATVTRGGVQRREIDSHTMQSRLREGLYFAGEVVDVDGPCGGYNLQIAFSTGFLAGQSAAQRHNR